jgi:hypothetical protein
MRTANKEVRRSLLQDWRARLRRLSGFAVTWVLAGTLSVPLVPARFMATPANIEMASLKPATTRDFDAYLAKVEAKNKATLTGPFLWIDELNTSDRNAAYANLKNGKVEIRREKPETGNPNGGLLHDWDGIVFIPGVKLEDVLGVLQDYNHHTTYYAPDVEQSKIESHSGDHFRVFMRFKRHKVVTVVLNTQQDIQYYRDSPTRAHSRSSATRIAQVENPGTPSEKEKAPGDDDGFLWRMETWWRMEERDGGVYVQNEVLSLTRDIPTGLGWMIEPFITNIPKETLDFTLQATRKAVLAKVGH